MKKYFMLSLVLISLSIFTFAQSPCVKMPPTVSGTYKFAISIDATSVLTIGQMITMGAEASLGTEGTTVSGNIYLKYTKTGEGSEIPQTANGVLKGTIFGGGGANWSVDFEPVTFPKVSIMMKNGEVQQFDITLDMNGDGSQTTLTFPNNATQLGGTLSTSIVKNLSGTWLATLTTPE